MTIPRLWQAARCYFGFHNPPKDKAFSCMGAVFVGGPCTRCSDPTARERRFLGNSWELGGRTREGDEDYIVTLSVPELIEALHRRGLHYIGDYPA